MKKIFLSAIAVSLTFSGWRVAANSLPPAPEISYGASANAGNKPAPKTSGAVAEYLKGVTFFNGKPNPAAEYYIYLQSASWCGPCNMEMPHIVDEYKIMKEDGRVEIILIGYDKNEEKALGFLTQYGAEFPGVLATDEKVPGLPGFAKARGIPNAIIVDADGQVVYKGHPGPLFGRKEWKIRTIEKNNH